MDVMREKMHDQQACKLFQHLAELKDYEKKGTGNAKKVEILIRDVSELEKAMRHYPEVKTAIFRIAKNLLLGYWE